MRSARSRTDARPDGRRPAAGLADDHPPQPARAGPAPREVDGHYLEGFWRSHQVPMGDVRENPAHLKSAGAVAAVLRPGLAVRPGPAGWSPSCETCRPGDRAG